MGLPSVVVEAGWLRCLSAGDFFGRVTRQALVNLGLVVIAPEGLQLLFQVTGVPEETAVQILPPNRADQPLDKRMRARHVRHRLNRFDLQDAQIGLPARKPKERIMVQTQPRSEERRVGKEPRSRSPRQE